MVANTAPIFGDTINDSWSGIITSADTSFSAPSTAGVLCFTAGVDGAMLFRLLAKAIGTNVQTVLRIFVNNGSTVATAGNNCLIKEITLPATTSTANAATSTDIEVALNLKMVAGHRIYVAIGTAVSAGWNIFAEGADY